MEKNVLLAGKEYPAGGTIASVAMNHNRKVVITAPFATEQNEEKVPAAEINTVMWNKSSSISSRSLVLQAENEFRQIDEAILIFDTSWFAPNFQSMTPELCTKAVDTMVSNYLYLSQELVSRFTKLKHGTIIYMLKTAAGFADSLGSRGETLGTPAGILPKAAESMFEALAESIAAKYATSEDFKILLFRGDSTAPDGSFAAWMFEYLDTLAANKGKPDIRHAAQWIKMGSKPPAGFSSLFRK